MFTKRSVLVGLLVLALARLVDAGVSSPPPPRTEGYLVEDLQSDLFRLGSGPVQQVTSWITETGALDTGFEFRSVDYSATAVDADLTGRVIVDVVSADWTVDAGTGVVARFEQDPRNPYSLVVDMCTFSGATTGDEAGFSADALDPGVDYLDVGETYTLTVAVGSPGGDTVDIWADPGSGGNCESLETIQGPAGSFFGLATQFVGPKDDIVLYVADFDSAFGSVWAYNVDVSASDVDTSLVDVLIGTTTLDLWPAVYTDVCGVSSPTDCQLVIGRPARSPALVSVHEVVTTTIATRGTYQLPVPSFGDCVASAGDVDKGGATDIAACGADNVLILSGEAVRDNPGATITNTDVILQTFSISQTGTGFPSGVLADVDVDGDGDLDIGIGAPNWSSDGKTSRGAVFFFDAATGKLHTTIEGKVSGDLLGSGPNPIIPLGDLSVPDGKLEMAIPAPGHRTDRVRAGDLALRGSGIYLPLIIKGTVPEPEMSSPRPHDR